jgi:hypothetical protein
MRASLDGAIAMSTRLHPNYAIPIIGRLKEDMLALRALLLDDAVLQRAADNTRASVDRAAHHMYSDASAFGWGVLQVDPTGPFSIPPPIAVELVDQKLIDTRGWSRTGLFSATECAASSAAREIWAVVRGIVALDLRDCHLLWHTDSTCATAAIGKWASSAPGVAEALAELFGEVRRRRISIEVVHVRRELSLMPVADFLSRRGWRDRQAEWSFARADVDTVLKTFRHSCDADLFASLRNHQFGHWCSQFLEEGSSGDAFFTPWWGHNWWAFPPLSQRGRVLHRLVNHLRSAKASVVWTSANDRNHSRHRSLSVVLVTTPVTASDPDAVLWAELAPAIVRSVTLFAPGVSPSSLLLPALRLIGDRGEPAPGPAPWALIAHLIRISDVRRPTSAEGS